MKHKLAAQTCWVVHIYGGPNQSKPFVYFFDVTLHFIFKPIEFISETSDFISETFDFISETFDFISEAFDFIFETFDFISETFDFISKGIWVLASYFPWGNGTDTKMCERKIFQGIVNVFSDHIWQWWTATSGANCCEQTAKFKRLLKVKGIHLGSEKDSWVLSSIYFINNLIIAKVMSALMRFHLTAFSVTPKTLSVLVWILPFSHRFHEDECTFESIFTLMRFRRKRSAS